jgi:membrane-associated protein
MDLIKQFIQFVLHLDTHLQQLVSEHGPWTYLILFAIVFCETGLVVMPFLPGDSLLFAAGTVAAGGALRIDVLILILIGAALCGDNLNYWIGRTIGPKVFSREDSRWLRKKHLERTHRFFERYGGKTIILARFVPIVRTFTPFVAGVGAMPYARFLMFSIAGAIFWVCLLTLAGFWFGQRDFVKSNFSVVILAIIVISLIPVAIELMKARSHAKRDASTRESSVGGDQHP